MPAPLWSTPRCSPRSATPPTPAWRAPALGVYRFWRDVGYAIGALIGGITSALTSLDAAVLVAAVLTAASGLLAWAFMRETHPRPSADGG